MGRMSGASWQKWRKIEQLRRGHQRLRVALDGRIRHEGRRGRQRVSSKILNPKTLSLQHFVTPTGEEKIQENFKLHSTFL